ncbi:MAG: gamma-glutamylcyclotransferase [Selenomonadaceae bacterium]|nr:gamma-glutamylcyclotransferase [Selenomonadaceae bacterium]
MEKIYIAYSSDMDSEIMNRRAPNSKFLGIAELHDWRLEFRGDGIGFATIEKSKSEIVPVAIWKITPEDEIRLDTHAGFPNFCRKEEIEFHSAQIDSSRGMVYRINSNLNFCVPGIFYFRTLEEIYIEKNFPLEILHSAFHRSCGNRFTLVTLKNQSEMISKFCPDAKFYGHGCCELNCGDCIEVDIWKIDSHDEKILDSKFPNSKKKIVLVESIHLPDNSTMDYLRGLIYLTK